MTDFNSPDQLPLSTQIDMELWGRGIVDIHATDVGPLPWPDGHIHETWKVDVEDPSGGTLASDAYGLPPAAGGASSTQADAASAAADDPQPDPNAIVTGLQWLDSNGNLLGSLTGFSKTWAEMTAGMSQDTDSNYQFAVSLMDGDGTATGGPLDDIIEVGSGGTMTISSGDGADSVFVWHAKNIIFDGGANGSFEDQLAFGVEFGATPDPLTGATVNLTTGTGVNPYGGTLTISNVEDVSGTAKDDVLTGNDVNNRLGLISVLGGLYGIGGNDTIRGEGGDDILGFAPVGTDRVLLADGGDGRDTLHVDLSFSASATAVLDLNTPANDTGVFAGAVINNIEVYSIGGFVSFGPNHTLDFRGSDAAETVTGGWGDDTINGGGGDDTLIGDAGIDTVNGGDGNDTLDDSQSSGFGDNASAGADHLDGGAGTDLAIIGRSATSVPLKIDLSNPAVMQTLADGTTLINVEQLTFFGGSGNDMVTGGALHDELHGGDGDDVLNGGGGDDLLDGGGGANILDGGPGNDTVNCPADRFSFFVHTESVGGVLTTTVAYLGSSPIGPDTVTNVENLQFADGTFALTGADQNRISNFDGHAFDDVMLQVASNGQLVFADMELFGNAGFGALTSPLPGVNPIGHADMNGDTIADAIVQVASTDQVLIAEQDGSGSGAPNWVAATSALKGGGADFQAVGVGDITGDATPDIILQNEGATGDGSILAVTSGGSGPLNIVSVSGPLRVDGVVDFRVVGVGDINGDGFADIVLQNQLNGGQVLVDDFHDHLNFTLANVTGPFQVVGAGDVNGDGHADVILQQASGGDVIYLDPTGGANDFKLAVGGVPGFFAKGVADVDNDGFAEILLQNPVTGEIDYRHVGATDADGYFGAVIGTNGGALHLV